MKLRIHRGGDRAATVIEVAGDLVGGGGGSKLLAACQGHAGRLTLDLAKLAIVDMTGLDTIRQLKAGGARLRGLSPAIDRLLES